jgi:hypothetical protein
MSLIIFFILPVIGLADEIEIGDVTLERREDFATAWTLLAKIPVTNYANHEYRVIGKLLFYDEDGVELYGIPFWGDVEAMESKVLQAKYCINPHMSKLDIGRGLLLNYSCGTDLL